MDELKDCPHCGSRAELHLHHTNKYEGKWFAYAQCIVCGARGKSCGIKDSNFDDVQEKKVKEDATKAWNMRYGEQ